MYIVKIILHYCHNIVLLFVQLKCNFKCIILIIIYFDYQSENRILFIPLHNADGRAPYDSYIFSVFAYLFVCGHRNKSIL